MCRAPPRLTRTVTLCPYSRLFRSDVHPRFARVTRIIEPDREELARAGDRRPQPFGRRDQRQRGEIDRGESAQALGRQFGGAEIGDHAREIANPAIRSEEHTSELQTLTSTS